MLEIVLCDASQPRETASLCKRYGLGVEIQSFSNPDYPLRNPQGVHEHRNSYEQVAIRALHGPFGDLSPGSCDRLIREVTRERFEFAYHYAKLFHVSHIILHHGYVPGTNSYRGWLDRSLEFWNRFLSEKDEDICFHLENLLEPDPQLLADVVRQVNKPNLKVCLDVGHAHCHGKISVQQWVEELGELIGYVHLHDNHGDVDEHLTLGEGNIALDEVCYVLERRAPKAVWALEVGPKQLERSLFWLETHGYWRCSL